MAFENVNTLTTREFVFGARRLGQILAVPSGRLDKVSLFLEPVIADSTAAESITVIVEAYDLDVFGNPMGAPLASDFKFLSDITISGFQNFRLEGNVPTVIAIVLRVPNGDQNNYVAWRYTSVSSGGEELLISGDDGMTWIQNPTRKFSYLTFSLSPNAIDVDQQTAVIAPGNLNSFTDTGPQFALGELDRTAVTGSTLAINFGDFVITAVIDQSGSMTWNDHGGLRFDFIKAFLADIDASLPVTSTATYSLIKFRGRRIGSLTIGVQGSQQFGLHLDGIRIVRKTGPIPPTGISDGLVVFEGLAQNFVDDGSVVPLTLGSTYSYAAFAFANLGGNNLYSTSGVDLTVFETPHQAPLSVANFQGSATIILGIGNVDFGQRSVALTWLNPDGFDYTTVTLVRRDDRPPTSPIDGTVLFSGPAATTSFVDTFGGTFLPITDFTYHYRIFTQNALGIKCLLPNAMAADVSIPVVPRPWEQLELALLYPLGNIPPVGFDVTPPGPPVLSIIESDGEMQLNWTPADVDTVRYRLYFNGTSFPTPLDDKGLTYSGTLLFDGTATSFSHRFLTNNEPHFYVLVALDQVENVSTPVKPLIAGRPPKPSATATSFIAPDPVTNFTVEVLNTTSTTMSWTNPKPPATGVNNFFFGDSVRIVANVAFLDTGNSQSFLTFQFIEGQRTVSDISQNDPVDPKIALQFANVPSINTDTIAGVLSVNPSLDIQNKMESCSIGISAALRVVNRVTNAVLAEVQTSAIQITFNNPFQLSIANDPPQFVSIRTWGAAPFEDPSNPCPEMQYNVSALTGVYAGSGNPFFGSLEASFRGQPLGAPLQVQVQLLDPVTGNPSNLVSLGGGQSSATLTVADVANETIDRSGAPTGDFVTKSSLPLTLPPSDIPGNVNVLATGTFNGYVRTTTLAVNYQPTLNVDLNLTAFQPDNVDRAEQSAFVYFAPFDAPEDQKVPVADFTVTSWSIRPLCNNIPQRPLVSEDNVPGVGVKAFTRGGLATNIFWGPGGDVADEQLYEIHVKVQAGGEAGEGFGMVRLEPVQVAGVNRIFLRSPTRFYVDSIFADGEHLSTWEVLARPEDDSGTGPSDYTSGQSFRTAILTAGGEVPSLDDGRIVTMTVRLNNDSDPASNPPSLGTLSSVLNSVRIRTNLTGPNGKAKSANAMIESGKAIFQISVNAEVPKKQDTVSEQELQDNTYYRIFGVQFQSPQSGLSLTLTVNTPVEVNGKSVSFFGGGGSLVDSSPPAFVELVEPLVLT